MTVREMIEFLSNKDPNAVIKVRVDDGCGCCSSGGAYEDAVAFVEGEEIHISD